MAEDNATLNIFYEQWKVYQDQLRDTIAPLTPEQLQLRAAPELRPLAHLVEHIVGARIYWLAHILGEDSTPVAAYLGNDDTPLTTAEELIAGLNASWQLLSGALARWTTADMGQTFPRERQGQHYDVSRRWVIWHLLEHDLHHGGEVSLALGIHGLPAPAL